MPTCGLDWAGFGSIGDMGEKHEIPDTAWLLALLMTPGIGVVTLNRVALALKEANIPFHAVVGAKHSVLQKGLPMGLEWASEALACCESATADRALFLHERVLKTGGQWLSRWTSEYPESLLTVMDYNAPPLLSVYGDVELLGRKRVSLVGSREPSGRGKVLAEELAAWSARHGRLVVSGGATGIDLTAHRAVLDAGGDTCVFIPQGGLTYEGPDWLKTFVDSGRAVVVSQLIPDAEWSASGAMGRNGTVAALGQLVCVVDPGLESGSQRTAQVSLDYDRRTLVYAYDRVGSAFQSLMRKGAYPILNEIGEWDEEYMESHWKVGAQLSRKQAELF